MENPDKKVIPGESIFVSKENLRPGQGTYELHGRIYASLSGYVFVKTEVETIEVVEVRRNREQKDHVIPYIDGIVTAHTPLTTEYTALLRKEDIRQHDRDQTEIAKCFQPGDIILARVLGFGDSISSFILTTAEDQLGVVKSLSIVHKVENFSWEEVKGVRSGITEPRKIAQITFVNGFFEKTGVC
ncbi:unnamed protein product [Auanema sp. JU1783]|nr:unnamed protein product [Auanema sp. JU1783]